MPSISSGGKFNHHLQKCQSHEGMTNAQDLTSSNSQTEENTGVTFQSSNNDFLADTTFEVGKDPQFAAEQKAGDSADMLGTNPHHSYPSKYKDFGRRFVPQYPYKDKHFVNEIDAEAKLDKIVKNTKSFHADDMKLIPVMASPELVLNVAMESAIHEASQPHTQQLKEKDILRSGDYWNDIWKEEVDPNSMLRSYGDKSEYSKQDGHNPKPELGAVRAKIMPGSKLYQLVSLLKQVSPRLLYVVNNKDYP